MAERKTIPWCKFFCIARGSSNVCSEIPGYLLRSKEWSTENIKQLLLIHINPHSVFVHNLSMDKIDFRIVRFD